MPEASFSPVEALRMIGDILSDQSLGHAERIAVVAVVLNIDNQSGSGWSSYRGIRERFGLSLDSIAGALKAEGGKAIGKYLEVVQRGSHGSVRYGVQRSGEQSALQPAERSGEQSALQPAERSGEQSALRSSGPSAPFCRSQRSGGRRQSNPISNPSLLPHLVATDEIACAKGPEKIDLDRPARRWAGITDADWTAWAAAYPAVEVRSEALRALEWCLANPAKGRKSNYRRFLTNWFQRTQDRGGSGGAGQPSRVPANPSRVHGTGTDYSKNVIDCSGDDPLPWEGLTNG